MAKNELLALLKMAVEEDIPKVDITTQALLPGELSTNSVTTAELVCKDQGIFVGAEIIEALLAMTDPQGSLNLFKHDGDVIQPGDKLCRIQSNFAVIMKIERTLLNFIQRLSGIATLTHRYVKQLNNPQIDIVDTRKTTPGLRKLEKQAVLMGGGKNHRHHLSDMVLIKENHLSELAKVQGIQSLGEKIATFKKDQPGIQVEVEIEHQDQLKSLDLSQVDIIMLDNFSPADLKTATPLIRQKYPHAIIEVSGNVTLNNIHQLSHLDIDRVAIGAITHSPKAVDLSLLLH